jgi:hypothetical protein
VDGRDEENKEDDTEQIGNGYGRSITGSSIIGKAGPEWSRYGLQETIRFDD